MGDEDFVSRITEQDYPVSMEHVRYERTVLRPSVSSVIKAVAEVYRLVEEDLIRGQRGQKNEPRQVAMYVTRELCDRSLKEIAEVFSLGSYGSVGAACSMVAKQLKSDEALRHRTEQIMKIIYSTFIQKKT